MLKPILEASQQGLTPAANAVGNELHGFVTVLRGIEGYGASSRIHRKHLFTSADLPITVTIIDSEEKIQRFLPILEVMVHEGLIAISDVEVIRYTHREATAPPA